VDWEMLGTATGTLVLLMAVDRLGVVVEALIRYGRGSSTPVSVIADGTLPTQRTINTTLERVEEQVADAGIRPPAVVVIGDVVNIAAEIAELSGEQAEGQERPEGIRLPGGVAPPGGTKAGG
jgi:uroporphyrin-III C-methyltransferase/precorrin-2 dehydrogenase/sirohydrochlorin ferrochelatase